MQHQMEFSIGKDAGVRTTDGGRKGLQKPRSFPPSIMSSGLMIPSSTTSVTSEDSSHDDRPVVIRQPVASGASTASGGSGKLNKLLNRLNNKTVTSNASSASSQVSAISISSISSSTIQMNTVASSSSIPNATSTNFATAPSPSEPFIANNSMKDIEIGQQHLPMAERKFSDIQTMLQSRPISATCLRQHAQPPPPSVPDTTVPLPKSKLRKYIQITNSNLPDIPVMPNNRRHTFYLEDDLISLKSLKSQSSVVSSNFAGESLREKLLSAAQGINESLPVTINNNTAQDKFMDNINYNSDQFARCMRTEDDDEDGSTSSSISSTSTLTAVSTFDHHSLHSLSRKNINITLEINADSTLGPTSSGIFCLTESPTKFKNLGKERVPSSPCRSISSSLPPTSHQQSAFAAAAAAITAVSAGSRNQNANSSNHSDAQSNAVSAAVGLAAGLGLGPDAVSIALAMDSKDDGDDPIEVFQHKQAQKRVKLSLARWQQFMVEIALLWQRRSVSTKFFKAKAKQRVIHAFKHLLIQKKTISQRAEFLHDQTSYFTVDSEGGKQRVIWKLHQLKTVRQKQRHWFTLASQHYELSISSIYLQRWFNVSQSQLLRKRSRDQTIKKEQQIIRKEWGQETERTENENINGKTLQVEPKRKESILTTTCVDDDLFVSQLDEMFSPCRFSKPTLSPSSRSETTSPMAVGTTTMNNSRKSSPVRVMTMSLREMMLAHSQVSHTANLSQLPSSLNIESLCTPPLLSSSHSSFLSSSPLTLPSTHLSNSICITPFNLSLSPSTPAAVCSGSDNQPSLSNYFVATDCDNGNDYEGCMHLSIPTPLPSEDDEPDYQKDEHQVIDLTGCGFESIQQTCEDDGREIEENQNYDEDFEIIDEVDPSIRSSPGNLSQSAKSTNSCHSILSTQSVQSIHSQLSEQSKPFQFLSDLHYLQSLSINNGSVETVSPNLVDSQERGRQLKEDYENQSSSSSLSFSGISSEEEDSDDDLIISQQSCDRNNDDADHGYERNGYFHELPLDPLTTDYLMEGSPLRLEDLHSSEYSENGENGTDVNENKCLNYLAIDEIPSRSYLHVDSDGWQRTRINAIELWKYKQTTKVLFILSQKLVKRRVDQEICQWVDGFYRWKQLHRVLKIFKVLLLRVKITVS